MISSQAFMLFNLALYVAILVVIGVSERLGRNRYRSRDRRTRYRRLSTEEAMRRIRKETLGR